MKWFKAPLSTLPALRMMKQLYGYEGLGLAYSFAEIMSQMDSLDFSEDDLCLWLKIHRRRAVQMFPIFCQLLVEISPIFDKISPIFAENCSKFSENSPIFDKKFALNQHGSTRDKERDRLKRIEREKAPAKTAPKNEGSDLFQKFWAAYPKKTTKKETLRYWESNKLDNSFAEILNGLDVWKISDQWTKEGNKYVPDPIRFLRQERWIDQPEARRGSMGTAIPETQNPLLAAKTLRHRFTRQVIQVSDLQPLEGTSKHTHPDFPMMEWGEWEVIHA